MGRSTLAVLALAATFMAAGAQGVHHTQYATNPVEHDYQGAANEPDGARSNLYGEGVGDCTLDLDDDARCTAADLAAWPAGNRIAQGCTDDSGRRPGGLCGAWTVGVAGEQFLPEPIGFRPLPCQLPFGQAPHRMLDVRQVLYLTTDHLGAGTGHPIFDLNRKLDDAGVHAAERALGMGPGSDGIAGPSTYLAWYGVFWDKNCNGVIDHFGGQERDARNEFTWIGSCGVFPGGPQIVDPDVCRKEPTTFLGWVVPGNHHAGPTAASTGIVAVPLGGGADLPGWLALCTLLGGSDASCDEEEALYHGDPLLGVQDAQAPDFYFYDYSGVEDVRTRTYVAAPNWPMYHYDQSLLVSSVVVGAVNPPVLDEGEGVYDVTASAMVDVDRLTSRSPHLEAFLTGLVKPAARSTWLLVRGAP